MQTAFTLEIDSPQAAVQDILTQVQKMKLAANSVGLIACHPDFADSGTLAAIHKELPFETVGCSVFGSAVNGYGGLEQLSMAVLSADDVSFTTVFTDEITEDNYTEVITKAVKQGTDALGSVPSLIIAFVPMIHNLSGHQILIHIDMITGGTPVFGTLSYDGSPDYSHCYTFQNGKVSRNQAAFLFIGGSVSPRFYSMAITAKNIRHQSAVVTKSDGYFVAEIDNIPFLDYCKNIGIEFQKNLTAITILPLVIDYRDGTPPIACSMYDISDRGAFCGIKIPEGTIISFAEIDYDSIIETCKTVLQLAVNDAILQGTDGIIAIPGFSRPMALSPNVEDEINASLAIIKDEIPFAMFYSGGEICPVSNEKKQYVNRFHNLAYTLMVLNK